VRAAAPMAKKGTSAAGINPVDLCTSISDEDTSLPFYY